MSNLKKLLESIANLIRTVLGKDKEKATALQITDIYNQEIQMANITTLQKYTVHVRTTAGPNKKTVNAPGINAFSILPDGIADLFPSDDGNSCVISGAAAGSAVVTVKRDLGNGTVLTKDLTVNVTDAPADNLEITEDTPVFQ